MILFYTYNKKNIQPNFYSRNILQYLRFDPVSSKPKRFYPEPEISLNRCARFDT
jgi:hypothetical protein